MNRGDPAEVLWNEKRREDQARQYLAGFARFGWREAGDPALLGPILGRAGVRPRRFVLL